MSNSRHLKRSNMPVSWPVQRKIVKYITRPKPGSYPRKYTVAAVVLLRDILKYAKTTKEVKFIMNEQEVFVNGKRITDIKFPCSIFDVVEIKETKDKFTMLFDEFGKIRIIPVKEDLIYLKVTNKTCLSKDKFQISFMNGFNVLVDEKKFKSININDTAVFDFAKKKIENVIPFKEGSYVYIINGKFTGEFAELKGLIHYNGLAADVAQIEVKGNTHNTAKEYCFVIGSKKEDLKRFE